MVHFAHWFAAVRKAEDREWVDISTVNVIGSAHAMMLAAEGNKKSGQSWAKANPIVRLIRLECQEVPGSALPPIGKYIA